MIDPLGPRPGPSPSKPNTQPPTIPPRIPRTMSITTPYPPPFIHWLASQPAIRPVKIHHRNPISVPSSFSSRKMLLLLRVPCRTRLAGCQPCALHWLASEILRRYGALMISRFRFLVLHLLLLVLLPAPCSNSPPLNDSSPYPPPPPSPTTLYLT